MPVKQKAATTSSALILGHGVCHTMTPPAAYSKKNRPWFPSSSPNSQISFTASQNNDGNGVDDVFDADNDKNDRLRRHANCLLRCQAFALKRDLLKTMHCKISQNAYIYETHDVINGSKYRQMLLK
jgi:hypothetical protein